MSAAASSVAHSQRWERTNARPSRSSSTTCWAPEAADAVDGVGRAWVRMSASATAETANDAASIANAAPAPAVATIAPPSAGPASRSASGLTSWSSALAWTRRCGGTSSGTIAPNAGPNIASPLP